MYYVLVRRAGAHGPFSVTVRDGAKAPTYIHGRQTLAVTSVWRLLSGRPTGCRVVGEEIVLYVEL